MHLSSRLFLAGILCLLAAAVLAVTVLPRQFAFLPATSFTTEVLNAKPDRAGVEVTALSQPADGCVIVEWKPLTP